MNYCTCIQSSRKMKFIGGAQSCRVTLDQTMHCNFDYLVPRLLVGGGKWVINWNGSNIRRHSTSSTYIIFISKQKRFFVDPGQDSKSQDRSSHGCANRSRAWCMQRVLSLTDMLLNLSYSRRRPSRAVSLWGVVIAAVFLSAGKLHTQFMYKFKRSKM